MHLNACQHTIPVGIRGWFDPLFRELYLTTYISSVSLGPPNVIARYEITMCITSSSQVHDKREEEKARENWLTLKYLTRAPRIYTGARMNNSRFSVYRGVFRKSIKACAFTHVSVFMRTRRADPRFAAYRIVPICGQEMPVHPTSWVCRLCVIWDHYIPPPFMGKGISPLIQKTRRNTHIEVKEALNCWTREIEKYNWSIIVG